MLVGATLAILIVAGTINALMFVLSLYFQDPAALGFSAFEAGLATLPAAAVMIAITPAITPLASKIGAGAGDLARLPAATPASRCARVRGVEWAYAPSSCR